MKNNTVLADGTTVWEFVEKWYPNYSSCEDIALHNDLTKLVDNEFTEGDSAHKLLKETYGGDQTNENITLDRRTSIIFIYEKAITNFLNFHSHV